MPLEQTDPTPESIEYLICAEFGREKDEKSLFLVQSYLRLFAVKGLVSPNLLRLYAQRAFAQYLRKQFLEAIDWSEAGVSESNHYIAKNYMDQIAELTAEICRVEPQFVGMQSTIGQMTNVVPSASPAGRFPASSPSLIGGPDAPRWFRR